MAAKSYSELLRDPRWQKKRLEILSSDNWRCRQCESKDNTLNVHHLYYIKGHKPWEYDNDVLITLCEKCHKAAHEIDWQKAFLDLNVTPRRLLDIALCIKYALNRYDVLTKEINEKYKVRSNHDAGVELELYVTTDEPDLHDLYNFLSKSRGKYNGSV